MFANRLGLVLLLSLTPLAASAYGSEIPFTFSPAANSWETSSWDGSHGCTIWRQKSRQSIHAIGGCGILEIGAFIGDYLRWCPYTNPQFMAEGALVGGQLVRFAYAAQRTIMPFPAWNDPSVPPPPDSSCESEILDIRG